MYICLTFVGDIPLSQIPASLLLLLSPLRLPRPSSLLLLAQAPIDLGELFLPLFLPLTSSSASGFAQVVSARRVEPRGGRRRRRRQRDPGQAVPEAVLEAGAGARVLVRVWVSVRVGGLRHSQREQDERGCGRQQQRLPTTPTVAPLGPSQ